MKASVCVTTFNEEISIGQLIESLQVQTKKPEEIVIVDAGSADQTVPIIRHYQKKDKRIKLLITEGASRARGRNHAVDLAKNEIVAMTDAGCIAQEDWLEMILEPFENKEVTLVAGFYDMTGKSSLQKAFKVFLGTLPSQFGSSFLPSTRSLAFRKSVFDEIGGFKETLNDTAEDTMFNYNAVSLGLKFTRVKSARVEWEMPTKLKDGVLKMYRYALGDAKSKIWYHPVKGVMSHNIKAVLKLARYLIGLFLVLLSLTLPTVLPILLVSIFVYCLWAFRKVFVVTNDFKSGLWGVAIQFASDFAVMLGFVRGFLLK